jgi:hypothetical protein
MANGAPEYDLVWSLNLVSGQVGRIQRHVFEHPAFADNQVEVEPYTPSPENWTPKTKAEYLALKAADPGFATDDSTPAADEQPPAPQTSLFGSAAEPVL